MANIPPWVVFHVPHDSMVIPDEVRHQFVAGDAELADELVRMTDHLTLDLLSQAVPVEQIVRAPVSCLVVDVERFVDDASEPMSGCGMGVVYERMSDGRPLRRRISPSERQGLIDTWYSPHHARLATATQRALNDHGRALLIDVHSFPSTPLPYEADQRLDRPDICIGTDPFHTPLALEHAFVDAFCAGQFCVRLNAPFAGAMVPMSHYGSERLVSAVMIEVNRALYTDESSGEKNGEFEVVAARIRKCVMDAVGKWGG